MVGNEGKDSMPFNVWDSCRKKKRFETKWEAKYWAELYGMKKTYHCPFCHQYHHATRKALR